MSIEYTKLPRLAELCEALSDDALHVHLNLTTGNRDPFLEINFYSMKDIVCLGSCYLTTSNMWGNALTIDEMIATLEQIQAHGFWGGLDVAA